MTTIDRKLVDIYLTNHLAAATGAVHRLDRMAQSYEDLPFHAQLVDLASQVRVDLDALETVISTIGLRPRRHVLALGRAGEAIGRLKLNGRVLSRSPLTPLVEIEALRTGISGKQALWQCLTLHADQLGLDSAELANLDDRAGEQLKLITELHHVAARGAFHY